MKQKDQVMSITHMYISFVSGGQRFILGARGSLGGLVGAKLVEMHVREVREVETVGCWGGTMHEAPPRGGPPGRRGWASGDLGRAQETIIAHWLGGQSWVCPY